MYFSNQPTSKKIVFLAFIFLVSLYTTPIMLTGRPYIDDLGRTLYGYSGWGLNGRPLSDLIMQIMSLGGLLIDLSPLNQIISIVILSASLYFYTKKYFNKINFFGAMTASFLFIANPFYIENLSYKFDSLPMALSMVMLLLPFTISLKGIVNQMITITLVIASLSLYQASIGLFAILSVLEIIALKSEHGNKKVLLSILNRMAQLFIAFTLYKIFIAAKFVTGEYNIIHSETLSLSSGSISILIENTRNVKWFLTSYLSAIPFVVKALFAIAIFFSTIKTSVQLLSADSRNNILSILVVISSPILVLILALAPLLMLKNPVFAPRVMLSISGAIMLYAYLIFRQIKSLGVQVILFLPIIWICIVYSYSFSSSSRSQSDLDALISTSIYNDISQSGKSFKYVSVSGEMPKSPQLLISESKLPLMSRLVPIYLSYDWLWGAELLNHYGMKLELKPLGSERDNLMCHGDLISKSQAYNLYSKEDVLFIDFKKKKC